MIMTETERKDAPAEAAAREIPVSELLQGARRVIIRHGDKRYVLQLTRQNKLILTKYDGVEPASIQGGI